MRLQPGSSLAALLALGWLSGSAPALASMVTPMDVEELAERSTVIVIGDVASIRSVRESPGAGIVTYVTVRIESSLRGAAGLAEVALRQPGGVWGERVSVVFGTPSFERGERVLVFAAPTATGHLRVTGLFQGKYRIEPDGAGALTAVRDAGTGASFVGEGRGAPPRIRLADLIARVRAGPGGETRASTGAPDGAVPAPSGEEHEITPKFTLEEDFGPVLWREETDEGRPVAFGFNPAGAPFVPGGARAAFHAALDGWTAVEGATIALADGGDTDHDCRTTFTNTTVSHGDPCDFMEDFDAQSCSGVLVMGGIDAFGLTPGERWHQILSAYVWLNHDIDCFTSVPGNYEELVGHGLGHAIGVGHSCGDQRSPDCAAEPLLDGALMRAFPHGDGRGALLGADDANAARFLYPPVAFADIRLNGDSFGTGDEIESTVSFSSKAAFDLYVFMVEPGGSFFFLGAVAPDTVAPLFTGVPPGYFPNITSGGPFQGGQAAGRYFLGLLLTVAGTDPYHPGDRLAADVVSYTFTP